MRILLVVLASLILTGPASAIDIGPCHSIGNCISVSGQIMLGDAAKFAGATSGYPVGTFVLLSGPGGYAGEALEMADIIWNRRFRTVVSRANGACASGCALVFLAGRQSIIVGRALLIFHIGFDAATGGAMPSETIDWLATQITRYGLTKRQAWALLTAAPPEGGRYATEEWARQLGFQYQVILSYLWMWQNCQARFCLALP